MKLLTRLKISINKLRVKRAKMKAIKQINKFNKIWGISRFDCKEAELAHEKLLKKYKEVIKDGFAQTENRNRLGN